MDKLRAIQYFNQAARTGSFTAAAKVFDVSTPSITQLIGALERGLGVALFHRTNKGISLTADGERYYETSCKVEADLRDVELRIGPRGASLRGTLVVGMRDNVGQSCVMSRIGRFLARHPDVDLVLKPVTTIEDIDEKNVDIALMTGWMPERNLVVRPLAQTQLLAVASPAYWVRKGRPEAPEDLRGHDCLVIRSTGGTQVDRWSFEKNGEQRAIDVRSRIFSDERNWLYEAACAGCGVIRVADLTLLDHLKSGSLVPVLTDWQSLESPTIFAAYAPSMRRSRLVRAFVDFLGEIFDELQGERAPDSHNGIRRTPMPEWFGQAHGRLSAYVASRPKMRQ